MNINPLNFQPLPGMASCHLQTILSSFFPAGSRPPSTEWRVELGGGDLLSCAVSTPLSWKKSHPTVVMVHGMGGSHDSGYMIRLARKLYRKGTKVVRVNLRGCGWGKGLSKLLYNAGTSGDVLKVLQGLKNEASASEITLCGFSLGGNLILKLAGELGTGAKELVKTFIAVCAPLDLAQAVQTIQAKRNRFYHSYYLKHIHRQARPGIPQTIFTLYEFDDAITAPPGDTKALRIIMRSAAASGFCRRLCNRPISCLPRMTHLLGWRRCIAFLFHPPLRSGPRKKGGIWDF